MAINDIVKQKQDAAATNSREQSGQSSGRYHTMGNTPGASEGEQPQPGAQSPVPVAMTVTSMLRMILAGVLVADALLLVLVMQ